MYICMSIKNYADNLHQTVNIAHLRGKFRWCMDTVHFLLYVNGFFSPHGKHIFSNLELVKDVKMAC